MSKLAIRSKRYLIKENCQINLIINTQTGETLQMPLKDCSATGFRCTLPQAGVDDSVLNITSIVSSAKLQYAKGEIFLGRLAVRRIGDEESAREIAFSTIDSKVPVSGPLSHFLDVDLSKAHNEEELSPQQFSLAHFVENEFTNVDLFNRTHKFSIFHKEWAQSKKYAYRTIRTESKGPRINLKRIRKNGRTDYLVMGSNDYLGLAAHPEVIEAGQKAFAKYGFSSTGSPVTTGNTDLHEQLIEQLAHIHQKEDAVLFNSGYAANVGIITALTTTNDLVIADQLCHASIQDAMQMARSTPRFFRHNNVEHLEALLKKERTNFNGALVATEGVFSMDGDVAKLDEIYQVARNYNCRTFVDQAHCFGVLGPNGFGVADKYHLLKEIDIIMGTFSKVCGGIGGFATGSTETMNWLRFFGRAHMFSVSLPPSTVAAVSKTLEIFTRDTSLVEKLRANIRHFVGCLTAIGFQVNPFHESAVIPVLIGDETKMGEMYQSLLDDGIWCIPIVYPAVGRKQCRFRFTVMANHSISDLDFAATCLEKAMLKANFKAANNYEQKTELKPAA